MPHHVRFQKVRKFKNENQVPAGTTIIDVEEVEFLWRELWGIPSNVKATPEIMLSMVCQAIDNRKGKCDPVGILGWTPPGGEEQKWNLQAPDNIVRVGDGLYGSLWIYIGMKRRGYDLPPIPPQ